DGITMKNNARTGITSYNIFSTSKPHPTIIDKYLMRPFVALMPRFILPNYVTILRFILIPFVVWMLLVENYKTGLILFIIAAFTDALDGAMARLRGQITDWGKLFDPLADKLLVGSVAVLMIVKFLNIYLAIIIILIEAWLITYNIFFRGRRK